jgi:hypothetical protein
MSTAIGNQPLVISMTRKDCYGSTDELWYQCQQPCGKRYLSETTMIKLLVVTIACRVQPSSSLVSTTSQD